MLPFKALENGELAPLRRPRIAEALTKPQALAKAGTVEIGSGGLRFETVTCISGIVTVAVTWNLKPETCIFASLKELLTY